MGNPQFWQRSPRIQLAVVMPKKSRRGIKFDAHAHPFHELAFLLDGDCHWHVGGRRQRLRAGELLLVPAGARHHETAPARAQARIGWIGFDFPGGPADVPEALRAPLSAGDDAAELRRLFAVVCAEHEGRATGHAERAEFALREILILLCRLLPAGAEASPHPVGNDLRAARLARSAALTLAGNLAQPMRIRDLARYHSLSTSHFTLLFQKHQGETPSRFLQNARLARAKALLREGDLAVKEIAAACGYVDAAHFCHAFKAATRMTPRAFRGREKG